LVGRSEELALLDHESGDERLAMVVAGAVGVGKSRLLAAWLAGIEAAGRPTVLVRATRATATIPFGAFARWLPEHLVETGDRLGVLLAAVRRLTRQGAGVVVAVDDAQYLDEGSAALVLHLAQHTEVHLLLALRSGEPCPDAIVALWKEGLATRLDLQPLSEPQMVELLEGALGGDVAPGTSRRLWHLTRGNPLYLREVVDAALAQQVLVDADGTWRWEGTLAQATRLTGLVSDRLGSCTPTERQVLELVALGEPLPLEVVASLAAPDVLAALESRQLVLVERRSSSRPTAAVRLAHPLYAEVLRSELATFAARGHHRALADAGVASGMDRQQPLRVATWLLEAGGDVDHAALMLRASHLALMSDDHEMAARLARASVVAGGGWRATLRQVEALGPLHRWDEIDALLHELTVEHGEPEAQAAVARVRAEQSFWNRHEDVGVARRILAEAAASLPAPARSSLLWHAARFAHVELDLEGAIRLATEAVAEAETPVDRIEGIACAAVAAVFLGRTRAALAMVRLAGPYAVETVEAAPVAGGYLAVTYSYGSYLDGRIDEAALLFQSFSGHDLADMDGSPRVIYSIWLAHALLAQGRVASATRMGRRALVAAGDENHFDRASWIASTLATAAAQSGAGAEAAAVLTWLDTRRRPSVPGNDLQVDLARAWVRAERGEVSLARQMAFDVAGRARAAGAWMHEALTLLDAVRFGGAALAAGRLGELTGVVEGRLVVAAADLAAGIATGNGVALDEVAARFGDMGAALLAAEAATAAYHAHVEADRRRSGAASRAVALRWLSSCEGAVTPLLAGLDGEPLTAYLTDREREVAGLAARGRTSRQIADALTISVRTVESHLHHAYTKLGISDRAQLAAALGTTAPD
jgi:DNA-binding CsgD family transcriptional regulator